MDQIVARSRRYPDSGTIDAMCISTHLTYFDHQFKAIVAALTDLDNVVVTKRHNKATTLEYLLKYYKINLVC